MSNLNITHHGSVSIYLGTPSVSGRLVIYRNREHRYPLYLISRRLSPMSDCRLVDVTGKDVDVIAFSHTSKPEIHLEYDGRDDVWYELSS